MGSLDGGRLRAVIFDFDGVLADAEPLHFRSLAAVLGDEGIQLSEEEYRARYIVLDDRKAIEAAFRDAGRALPELAMSALIARKSDCFEALLDDGVPLFPGVAETVRALGEVLPLAIASSALRGEIVAILEGYGLSDAFVDIVGADEVAETKPHPAPYLEALARVNALCGPVPAIRPEECVVIEDTVGGIQGAKAAEMRVVAVTNSFPAEQLREADRIVATLEGLTPETLDRLLKRET